MCTRRRRCWTRAAAYVYGVARDREARRASQRVATEADVDKTRRDVEGKAFGKLVSNLQTTWADVIKEQSRPPGTAMYQTP